MAQKGLWNLAKEKIMMEEGELPNEEGDVVKEYKAMHEEDFWSSWLREDERTTIVASIEEHVQTVQKFIAPNSADFVHASRR